MRGNHLPLLADRVLNRPLLLHPAKADTILSVLEGRITQGFDLGAELGPEASRFVGTREKSDGRGTRNYTRAAGKTAIITIDGSLVNRGAWVGASSGLTSYEGIAAQLDEIEADGGLENLVIDMNSYGGEATGMFALAGKIRALRKKMHVVAVINDVAASAGYGIVSAADRIVVSPTSIVGSIGVVMMHVDRSAELAAAGVRPTFIHAGAKKVDGNPFGPLPDAVRADMQKDVNAFYDQFLATVEQGRGKGRLSAQRARETEADVYIGQEAIDRGLADAMGSLEDVLADLSRPVRAAGKPSTKGHKMDRENLPSVNAGTHTEADMQAAITSATAAGHSAGVTAERTRLSAILSSDAGKANPSAAMALALAADSPSAETAISILGTLGGAVAPAAAAPSIPSLAQRAAGQKEIGASAESEPAPAEASRKGWGKAVAKINKGFSA